MPLRTCACPPPRVRKHESANCSCRCANGSCSTAVASARRVWCAAHGTPRDPGCGVDATHARTSAQVLEAPLWRASPRRRSVPRSSGPGRTTAVGRRTHTRVRAQLATHHCLHLQPSRRVTRDPHVVLVGEQNDHGDSRDRCRIVVRHRPRAQVYQVGGAATRYQVHATRHTRHTRHTQPPMVC